jgi:signal transduction histidine kinase
MIGSRTFFWAMACACGMPLCAQDPPHHRYTANDGLPSGTVYSIAQDSAGYIWFGTDAGASRFDGQHFVNYTTSDGLADNEVLTVQVDPQGRVWFLSLNGLLSYWQEGLIHNGRTDPWLANVSARNGISSLAFGASDHVLIGGQRDQLFDLDMGRRSMVEVLLPIGPSGPVSLANDVNGAVAVCSGASISEWRDGGLLPWCAGPISLIGRVLFDQQHRLLGRTESDLVELDRSEPKVIARLPKRIQGDDLRPMHGLDASGRLWFHLDGKGILCKNTVRADTASTFLFGDRSITHVFEDREGSLWFGTQGDGVILVTREQMSSRILAKESGANTNVTCLKVDVDGTVRFGLDDGSIRLLVGHGSQEIVPTITHARRDVVRAIADAPNGNHYAISDLRVVRWKGSSARPVLENLPGYSVRDSMEHASEGAKGISIGPFGEVLVSYFGIASLKERGGKNVFVYDTLICPSRDRIYAVCMDRHNDTWYEVGPRLHLFHQGTTRAFPELDSLFGVRISAITLFNGDTLAIASQGGGIALLHDGRVLRRFSKADGLPSDQCRKVRVVNGRLLIATDKGACIINDPFGAAHMRTWTMNDGLPGNDITDIALRDSTLLLAIGPDLCMIAIGLQAAAISPPALTVASISFDGQDVAITDTIRVLQGAGSFTLRCQAITFRSPGLTEYQLCSGPNGVWQNMPGGLVSFNDPAAGEQLLRFRARGPGTNWSREARIFLQVRPRWFRTVWFRMLLLLVCGLAVVFTTRYLASRRLRQRLRESEKQRALADERQRIAQDMHDDIGAEMSGLLLLTRHSATSGSLSGQDKSNLADIEGTATRVAQKIQDIVWSLDPKDDKLDVSIAHIQGDLEDMARTHGLRFVTSPITGLPDLPFPSAQRRELQLLMTELLHNVVKHAGATTVELSCTVEHHQVLLVLKDDGIGFDPRTTGEKGHGLANLQARVRRLNGLLFHVPEMQKGMRAEVFFPLPQEPKSHAQG